MQKDILRITVSVWPVVTYMYFTWRFSQANAKSIVRSCIFEEKWNSNELLSGRINNNTDKKKLLIFILIKAFDFDFSTLQAHQVLHPLPTTTHYPPPLLPHRTHSPNLQLLLVIGPLRSLGTRGWRFCRAFSIKSSVFKRNRGISRIV